jgi:hypothetical protein
VSAPAPAKPTTGEPPLAAAVRAACRGDRAPLELLVRRRGGLPGSRPNLRLAREVALGLAANGPAGNAVLRALRGLSAAEAPSGSADEMLPVVGVLALGREAAKATDPEQILSALAPLQRFAEDARRHVRDAAVAALREAVTAHGALAVSVLVCWTDGYLQADAALRAMTAPEALEALHRPAELLERLGEAFRLAEAAPRAHERSQGWRALVRTWPGAAARVARRFPAETPAWIAQRAVTQVPALREAIARCLDAMRAAGVRECDVAAVRAAIARSERAPRDPRSDVGPTRERGAKARKRGRGGVRA